MILSDEYGKYPVMFMDNSRGNKYSDYLELGNQLPEKGDIIAIIGTKSSDIIFADYLLPLKEKIYMKLGDLN
jgi:hypothetical protein